MNHLLRDLAPISDAGWALIDSEAKSRLASPLAARRVVDFAGPHGWEHSATNLGRVAAVASAPCPGVTAVQRRVLPLVEVRASFEVSLDELRAGDRGAVDVDLEQLDKAAHRIAVAENIAVFHGWRDASIAGISDASPHQTMALGEVADEYPRPVADAVERLLAAGIGGPYALALGGELYRRVVETAEQGGYPLLDHLRKILAGPVVWAPGVAGAIVLSQRGGDFTLESGEDLSIGYESHDANVVRLYIQESFSFHVATPEAAVALAV
jgi:uncharacterized linocin/CFP29 family protein